MRAVLGGTAGIGAVRGTWFQVDGRSVMPMYHPSYLLRHPQRTPGYAAADIAIPVIGCHLTHETRVHNALDEVDPGRRCSTRLRIPFKLRNED